MLILEDLCTLFKCIIKFSVHMTVYVESGLIIGEEKRVETNEFTPKEVIPYRCAVARLEITN